MHAALFDKEMKYLHDNDVRVITRSDLGYDENKNYLYKKLITALGTSVKKAHSEMISLMLLD